MADLIGAVELEAYDVYSIGDRTVTLQGFYSSRVTWNQINELFALSKQAVIKQILGGRYVYTDLTEEERNVQYCLFDHDKSLDGWYILRGFRYNASQFYNHWGWMLSMFFIGTDAIRQRGYYMMNLEDEDNDWEV